MGLPSSQTTSPLSTFQVSEFYKQINKYGNCKAGLWKYQNCVVVQDQVNGQKFTCLNVNLLVQKTKKIK